MTYGLKITGTDGTTVFQVCDSDEDQDNYQVVATGTGSSVSLDDAAYGGATGNPRLFFEPVNDVTTADVTNSGKDFSFKRYDTTEIGTTKTSANPVTQSVNWIILKDVGTSPDNSATMGSHGLLIKKSNGDISFDSRRLNSNSSFRLLGVEDSRSVGGDEQTTAATVDSFDSSTTSLYVSADNMYYYDLGTSGEVHGFATLGPAGGTKFLRHAFYVWIYEPSGGARAQITRYYSNPFPIIYGELR